MTCRGWHLPTFSVAVLALGLLGVSYLRKLLLIKLPMKYIGQTGFDERRRNFFRCIGCLYFRFKSWYVHIGSSLNNHQFTVVKVQINNGKSFFVKKNSSAGFLLLVKAPQRSIPNFDPLKCHP